LRRPAARLHRHLHGDETACRSTIRLSDPPLHEFVATEPGEAGGGKLPQGPGGHSRGKVVDAPRGSVATKPTNAFGHPAAPLGGSLSRNSGEIWAGGGAIIEAGIECHKKKLKVIPEIMIPLYYRTKKKMGISSISTRQSCRYHGEGRRCERFSVPVGHEGGVARAVLLAGRKK